MNPKEHKVLASIKMYLKLLPIIFKCEPQYMSLMFTINIFYSLLVGFMAIVSANFFDFISESIGNQENHKLILIILMFFSLIIFNQILDGIGNFMYLNFLLKIEGKLRGKLHQAASVAEPVFFEDPKYLDAINKADQGVVGAYTLIGSINGIVVYQLPYLIVMSIYMMRIKPILGISLLLIFIPAFITQFLKGSVFAKLEEGIAPLRRELEYYKGAVYAKENFKETRIWKANIFFINKILKSLEQYNSLDWKLKLKVFYMEIGANIISISGYFLVIILLLRLLINREVSIGEFSAIFASMSTIFTRMQVISNWLMNFSQYLPLAKNYYDFLNMPTLRYEEGCYSKDSAIIFENVVFSYPNSDNPIINNVSLKINPYERIAIVGENGAGKTTLAKLIIGLYRPISGSIRIGNLDISRVSLKYLFNNTSVLLQNFQKYKFSLEENVVISDIRNKKDYTKSLEKADIKFNDSNLFVNSGDTILSKEFGGIDVSGGIWQRIAIARAIYRNSDLIIMDEPTSAIDPIEETKLYNKFIEISKDKTTIIVTHRLGLARHMDRIIVLENGKILEDGKHDELIRANGKYSSMWKLQSEMYNLE